MAEDLEHEERGGFEHRVIPAAGAARPSTSAPNSVFAMGGEAPAPAPEPKARVERTPIEQHAVRALQHIEACGELSSEQLAQVMQLGVQTARKVTAHLSATKRVVSTRQEGRKTFWGIKQRGMAKWLEKKAAKEIAATGAAPQLVAPPRVGTTSTPPEWQAAIFSTGDVLIEAGGASVRLPRESARGLLAWLLKVDQAVQA